LVAQVLQRNTFNQGHVFPQFDQRNKRTFLRRTKIPELTQRDFFVGSKINVFGRQFDIVDYADDTTRTNLAKYRKKYVPSSTAIHSLICNSHLFQGIRFAQEQYVDEAPGQVPKDSDRQQD